MLISESDRVCSGSQLVSCVFFFEQVTVGALPIHYSREQSICTKTDQTALSELRRANKQKRGKNKLHM
jgi:hypothetical protein